MNYGFVKIAAAIPTIKVADCKHNAQQIKALIADAENQGVQLMLLPMLSLTGCSCKSLFMQQTLLQGAMKGLCEITDYTTHLDIALAVGLPLNINGRLINGCAVVQKGKILGIVPLKYPNDSPFSNISDDEELSITINEEEVIISKQFMFCASNLSFAIGSYNRGNCIPPCQDADIILFPTNIEERIGEYSYQKQVLKQFSAHAICGCILSSCGYGESTTDSVYSGYALICENGTMISEGERFCLKSQLVVSEIDVEKLQTEKLRNSNRRSFCQIPPRIKTWRTNRQMFSLTRSIDPQPFVPDKTAYDERCREVFAIQVAGLCKRIEHTHCQTVVIGISGGLDSTLALLVCIKAFDRLSRSRKDILGITMPGFGTTDRTYNNAIKLMEMLGISFKEISIKEACIQHFKDISHDINNHNITYENSQARERTQILMDIANQANGMVIGTGDLSELALGWATYNGDHMSMYGVNAGVPKTLIQHLVRWIADTEMSDQTSVILRDIVDTPISPELIPADEQGNIKQKTEDLVGPYELHDFFIYHFIRNSFSPKKIFYLAKHAFEGKYKDEVIKKWLTTFFRRFFNQQFKRSCLPDGPKVGSVSLSPREDWRMPSDASSAEWLKECDEI